MTTTSTTTITTTTTTMTTTSATTTTASQCSVPTTTTTTTTAATTNSLCSAGFTWDSSSCIDIDECSDGSHACNVFATCFNSDGSYDCNCKSGFSDYKDPDGNGEVYCRDIADPRYQNNPHWKRIKHVTTNGNFTFIISTYYPDFQTAHFGMVVDMFVLVSLI